MATVRARRVVPVRASDAEAVWYDLARWPAFVEGFARIVSVTGEWPRAGAEVTWETNPAGRGRVTERVVGFQTRGGQEVEVADETLTGTQRVTFEPLDEGCAVELELDYRLVRGGPLMVPVDLLFIRRTVRMSLQDTLARFARELNG